LRGLSREETAARAGVDVAYVDQLIAAGVLNAAGPTGLTLGDVRRVGLMRSLQEAGLPLDSIARGLQQGVLTLDFVDGPDYERFAGLGDETFEAASARTGVPVDLLLLIREAIGLGVAHPRDRLREDELEVVPFVESQVRLGFRRPAIERLLRAWGDSLRRTAEAEAGWWRSEVTDPRLAAGVSPDEISAPALSEQLMPRSERALMAVYHAQQAQTWTSNIVAGFEYQLARAGIHVSLDRPPAICFLDITGYTRLTQEHGDRAAADLAETLSRLVKRSSVAHAGRPVKWLGDGVMFYFRDPGPGVLAALEMVDGIVDAGLPPAHVGLHAGPVVVQEGDYYGQTVNLAARIADYARPGEVLVSDEVVAASLATDQPTGLTFNDIGNVELKGVAGVVHLAAARRDSAAR
jgi:adenylate cyclase